MSGAKNGRAFLDNLNPESLPDIVIMDIIMPVMDGYETTTFLKLQYPSIKVLAISMFDNEDKIEKVLSLGASGFIQKSADASAFLEAISDVYQNKEYISKLL
ncbi:transcriptional regulatory protein DegU [mine drainage metagenome]|uniref:Transcriptional regulatory protein DegU n=1 Tax=mine drainage metagenome TaxID=410659 RepID=A0A1J5RZD8_9ZZZZ